MRSAHRHAKIHVLQDTIVHEREESKDASDTSLHLLPKGERKPAVAVDYANLNLTEEELKAKLASYDYVVEAHNNNVATTKYHNRNVLVRKLLESILDTKALHSYRIPLCFREIDDDLAVCHDEVETPLD